MTSYSFDSRNHLSAAGNSSYTPFLYNGQYGVMTDRNGLICMQARYYNPNPDVHRFVSTDILEGDISDPPRLNRYAYGSNNSVNGIELTGHQVTTYMVGILMEKKYQKQ
jgi:RHS repeat-associated protein